jgi:hypothetical protein
LRKAVLGAGGACASNIVSAALAASDNRGGAVRSATTLLRAPGSAARSIDPTDIGMCFVRSAGEPRTIPSIPDRRRL